jgi:hypothetical protein
LIHGTLRVTGSVCEPYETKQRALANVRSRAGYAAGLMTRREYRFRLVFCVASLQNRSGCGVYRMERLGVIVPYRDREAHLSQLVPHLAAYFTRDKADRRIPVSIAIVEQPAGATFNRGFMKNIGFKLLRDRIDYVCFHDVDYLPIWADYSLVDNPTMIVWYGFESRPIDPQQPEKRVSQKVEDCLAAVVLMRKEQFERVNGYSNHFWGWGFEDADLKMRLEWAGFETKHRKGTFIALDHRHEGVDIERRPTESHIRNRGLLESRWTETTQEEDWQKDGLSTMEFDVVWRRSIPLPPETRPDIKAEHILVRYPTPPTSTHGS